MSETDLITQQLTTIIIGTRVVASFPGPRSANSTHRKSANSTHRKYCTQVQTRTEHFRWVEPQGGGGGYKSCTVWYVSFIIIIMPVAHAYHSDEHEVYIIVLTHKAPYGRASNSIWRTFWELVGLQLGSDFGRLWTIVALCTHKICVWKFSWIYYLTSSYIIFAAVGCAEPSVKPGTH